MKKVIINALLIVSLLTITGCSTYKTRVPWSAFRDNPIVYYSDIQSVPVETFQYSRRKLDDVLVSARIALPDEAYQIIADVVKEIINTIPETSKEYFGFRKKVVIINREILIKGYTNGVPEKILEKIKSMPADCIVY